MAYPSILINMFTLHSASGVQTQQTGTYPVGGVTPYIRTMSYPPDAHSCVQRQHGCLGSDQAIAYPPQ